MAESNLMRFALELAKVTSVNSTFVKVFTSLDTPNSKADVSPLIFIVLTLKVSISKVPPTVLPNILDPAAKFPENVKVFMTAVPSFKTPTPLLARIVSVNAI